MLLARLGGAEDKSRLNRVSFFEWVPAGLEAKTGGDWEAVDDSWFKDNGCASRSFKSSRRKSWILKLFIEFLIRSIPPSRMGDNTWDVVADSARNIYQNDGVAERLVLGNDMGIEEHLGRATRDIADFENGYERRKHWYTQSRYLCPTYVLFEWFWEGRTRCERPTFSRDGKQRAATGFRFLNAQPPTPRTPGLLWIFVVRRSLIFWRQGKFLLRVTCTKNPVSFWQCCWTKTRVQLCWITKSPCISGFLRDLCGILFHTITCWFFGG